MRLEDFQPELDIVRSKGYNPIGLSYGTGLFMVFETDEESERFMSDNSEGVDDIFSYSREELVNESEIIWLNNQ